MTAKKILKKIVKNGNTYEIEGSKVFIITEDIVTVSQDSTKGVAPYNTSYGYTNIDINANAGIEWVEGAIYSFIVDTEMVAASAYRNVRVRIGNGAYIPMKNWANSILAGSSYMTKGRTQFFVYKTVYESGGALHMTVDTSYSAMSVAEGKAGTATTGRVLRADYLKQIIEYHIGQNLPTVGDGTITLEDEEGNELGSFGVNDTGDTTITIPSGGGSGGDLDIDSVNALIDMKLGDYDSLFSVSNGLYKILNSIDSTDEIGLESGNSWADIVSNQTSMNKISHCYAVMCYIANSSVAMNGILGSASATKEIAECWNSISIIAESELASDLYLASQNGIANLFAYETAQDAFFTSLARKTSIIQNNLLTIVSNNDILEAAIEDSLTCSLISNSTQALVIIAGDSDKIEIVKNNTVIMNALASNSSALGEISDNDFFTEILENSTYLNTCANSEAGKSKINSYEADDLLPAVYYWTGDLGYETFAELVEDETAVETVENSTEGMLIIESNQEAIIYFLNRYESNTNTKVYIPMDYDLLDHGPNSKTVTNSGGVALTNLSGVKIPVANFQTGAKYLSFPNVDNMSGAWTVSMWAMILSGKKEGEWLFTQGTSATNRGLHLGYSTGTRGLTFAMYGNDADTSSYGWEDGNRHNYTFTWNGSNGYCIYVDGVLKKSGTLSSGFYSGNNTGFIGTWFTDQSTRKFDGYMSEFFIETGAWSSSKIAEFVNDTKKNYGK